LLLIDWVGEFGTMRNCIVDNQTSTSSAGTVNLQLPAKFFKFVNSIMVVGNNSAPGFVLQDKGDYLHFINSDIVCSSGASTRTAIINGGVNYLYLYNLLVSGFTYPTDYVSPDSYSDYVATNAARVTASTGSTQISKGTHNRVGLTMANEVVSLTSDLTPKAGGTNLRGVGAERIWCTNGVDLLGRARSSTTPTIGAIE
jgi:hypothetical protein